MLLVYMAHPFGGRIENLERARRWYTWLVHEFPRCAFVSQWMLECELFDDSDPAVRGAALERDAEIVRRCDVVVLVGGEISLGMRHEADTARVAHKPVINLTRIGAEPPRLGSTEWTRDPWIATAAGVLSYAQPIPSEVA